MTEKGDLEALKDKYKVIRDKHSLPEFDELNRDFHIEKICEEETDYLIREIRRYMGEKIGNYLRFLESILNPVNSASFIFSVINSLNEEDKKELDNVYKELSEYQLRLIYLDTDYNEEEEVRFIKGFFEKWQKIKNRIIVVLDKVKNNWNQEFEEPSKGYYG